MYSSNTFFDAGCIKNIQCRLQWRHPKKDMQTCTSTFINKKICWAWHLRFIPRKKHYKVHNFRWQISSRDFGKEIVFASNAQRWIIMIQWWRVQSANTTSKTSMFSKTRKKNPKKPLPPAIFRGYLIIRPPANKNHFHLFSRKTRNARGK